MCFAQAHRPIGFDWAAATAAATAGSQSRAREKWRRRLGQVLVLETQPLTSACQEAAQSKLLGILRGLRQHWRCSRPPADLLQAARQIAAEEAAAAAAKLKREAEEEEKRILQAWTAHKADDGLVSADASVQTQACRCKHGWCVGMQAWVVECTVWQQGKGLWRWRSAHIPPGLKV